MKWLREERKIEKAVKTCGLLKTQEVRDVATKRKHEAKKKQEEKEERTNQKAKERQRRFREKTEREKCFR